MSYSNITEEEKTIVEIVCPFELSEMMDYVRKYGYHIQKLFSELSDDGGWYFQCSGTFKDMVETREPTWDKESAVAQVLLCLEFGGHPNVICHEYLR